MEIHKYPTVKFAPWIITAKKQESLDEIYFLLEDEENEKLKQSRLVSFPGAYIAVINYYGEWDEEELESFWIQEFYENFPDTLFAKLYHNQNAINSITDLNGLTLVEELFKEEIDLLLHDQPNGATYIDEEYRLFIQWLVNYYYINNRLAEAKQLYLCATSLDHQEFTRDLAFIIKGIDRNNLYFKEEDDNIQDWCYKAFELMGKDIQPRPTLEQAYILLNKNAYDWNTEDVSMLTSIEDLDVLRKDMRWVFFCGAIRISKTVDDYNLSFIYNLLYVAGHYRLYDILEDLFDILKLMPENLFDETIGDIGIELLQQPLSILANKKPAILSEILTASHLEAYHKNVFFEILCYTYRLTRNKVVLPEIEKFWKQAKDKEHELLGYMIVSIIDHEIEDYKDKIALVYDRNLIDLTIFEKREDLKPMIHMRIYDAETIEGTKLETMLKSHKLAIDKVNRNAPIDVDEDIDRIIEETIAYDAEQMEIQKHFLEDDYSEDELFEYFEEPKTPIVNQNEKVGRNDPCPCGSGSKYKKCCWNMN